MNNAIEFAKEIERKKQAIKQSTSDNLKRQYRKSVNRSIKELKYYCNLRGLSINEVWKEARHC